MHRKSQWSSMSKILHFISNRISQHGLGSNQNNDDILDITIGHDPTWSSFRHTLGSVSCSLPVATFFLCSGFLRWLEGSSHLPKLPSNRLRKPEHSRKVATVREQLTEPSVWPNFPAYFYYCIHCMAFTYIHYTYIHLIPLVIFIYKQLL